MNKPNLNRSPKTNFQIHFQFLSLFIFCKLTHWLSLNPSSHRDEEEEEASPFYPFTIVLTYQPGPGQSPWKEMASPLESLLSISGSVSTSSTLIRLRIFRHDIPEILQNSGNHSLSIRIIPLLRLYSKTKLVLNHSHLKFNVQNIHIELDLSLEVFADMRLYIELVL